MQGDKKLRGTVKLVPGSFNIQCTEAPAAKKKKKGERDFPLTVLIEVPNRDPVRLATDNDREMRGWVEVTTPSLSSSYPLCSYLSVLLSCHLCGSERALNSLPAAETMQEEYMPA